MTAPLTEEQLQEMVLRDEMSAGGVVAADYHCATDRHLLLGEVNRLLSVIERLRQARPVGQAEGKPWKA